MLSYGGLRIMNIYENERNFNELAHGQNIWETINHGFPVSLLCIAKMMQDSNTFKCVFQLPIWWSYSFTIEKCFDVNYLKRKIYWLMEHLKTLFSSCTRNNHYLVLNVGFFGLNVSQLMSHFKWLTLVQKSNLPCSDNWWWALGYWLLLHK